MNFSLFGLESDDLYFILSALCALAAFAIIAKNTLRQNRFSSRVKALQERRQQLKSELSGPRKRARKEVKQAHITWVRLVVNKMNLLQQSQVGKISKLLINAGYRSKDAIFIFAFLQLVFPIVGLAVAFATVEIDFSDLPSEPYWKYFVIIGLIYFGLKLPSIMVINARDKRYAVIQKSLSDTLDLMLICAESGLSLGAAIDRVGRELFHAYPEMAQEMSLTSIELGFLPDRKKALLNLSERVDMPEIRGIVSVLIQTEKYGTPVAQALRVLASEFRTQRMLRAEQKAARLPALMTVPMIVFILPTLFVIILTPAVISIMDNMLKK